MCRILVLQYNDKQHSYYTESRAGAASENPEDLHAFPGMCFILQLKIHFLSSFEFIGCTQAY